MNLRSDIFQDGERPGLDETELTSPRRPPRPTRVTQAYRGCTSSRAGLLRDGAQRHQARSLDDHVFLAIRRSSAHTRSTPTRSATASPYVTPANSRTSARPAGLPLLAAAGDRRPSWATTRSTSKLWLAHLLALLLAGAIAFLATPGPNPARPGCSGSACSPPRSCRAFNFMLDVPVTARGWASTARRGRSAAVGRTGRRGFRWCCWRPWWRGSRFKPKYTGLVLVRCDRPDVLRAARAAGARRAGCDRRRSSRNRLGVPRRAGPGRVALPGSVAAAAGPTRPAKRRLRLLLPLFRAVMLQVWRRRCVSFGLRALGWTSRAAYDRGRLARASRPGSQPLARRARLKHALFVGTRTGNRSFTTSNIVYAAGWRCRSSVQGTFGRVCALLNFCGEIRNPLPPPTDC